MNQFNVQVTRMAQGILISKTKSIGSDVSSGSTIIVINGNSCSYVQLSPFYFRMKTFSSKRSYLGCLNSAIVQLM